MEFYFPFLTFYFYYTIIIKNVNAFLGEKNVIFDIETLSKVTFGANTVKEENGKIVIRRYSDQQADSLWGKMTSQQRRPTSVYFEFKTDAEFLHISYGGAETDAKIGMLNFSLFEFYR